MRNRTALHVIQSCAGMARGSLGCASLTIITATTITRMRVEGG